MNLENWLQQATTKLEAATITTARLDVLVLLEDALLKDRSWILAHPEFELSQATADSLKTQIMRRSSHEPLAYIRGRSEFYGREFAVTPATLQPRPETETMIDVLKTLNLPDAAVIADIGTGSGAICITAKFELPHVIVHAVEIQADALAVAQKNAQSHEADITFHEGNLLEPLFDTRLDVILANLPYVPDSHTVNQAAMQEPAIALFGGQDGLDVYREMFAQTEKLPAKLRYIITESLPFQHETLARIALSYGFTLAVTDDFIQVFMDT